MGSWNAGDYLKFGTERTQPAVELAGRFGLLSPASVLDVGCGPGNSTQVLQARFPEAEIIGIDSSEEMLQAARENLPGLEFLRCDVSCELSALNRRFDVVFSNACIQWVPDHPALLKNLMGLLNPGGVLAVQTPMNYEEPIHQIIGRTAQSERWREKIKEPGSFTTCVRKNILICCLSFLPGSICGRLPIFIVCSLTRRFWIGTGPLACGPIWRRCRGRTEPSLKRKSFNR